MPAFTIQSFSRFVGEYEIRIHINDGFQGKQICNARHRSSVNLTFKALFATRHVKIRKRRHFPFTANRLLQSNLEPLARATRGLSVKVKFNKKLARHYFSSKTEQLFSLF